MNSNESLKKNNRNLLLTTSLSQFWFRLHPSSWPLSDNMVSIGWSVDLGKLETSRPQELATLAIKHRHFPHIQPETFRLPQEQKKTEKTPPVHLTHQSPWLRRNAEAHCCVCVWPRFFGWSKMKYPPEVQPKNSSWKQKSRTQDT